MSRILVLFTVFLPGCMAPQSSDSKANSQPKQQVVSAQSVGNPDGAVRAFRVDIGDTDRPAPRKRYTLSPIPIDENGSISQQSPLPMTEGRMFIFPREIDPSAVKHSVLVRVYRPGYRTIEFKPGYEARPWQWATADFRAQETAIDDLLGLENTPDEDGWWNCIAMSPRSELAAFGLVPFPHLGDSGLLPGSVDATHRDVILFAASEFKRLAKIPAPNSARMENSRHRLQEKARQLIRYADEQTTEQFYLNQSRRDPR